MVILIANSLEFILSFILNSGICACAFSVVCYVLWHCRLGISVWLGISGIRSGVPRWRLHRRQELATLPSVGANP